MRSRLNIYQLATRLEVCTTTIYAWLNKGIVPRPTRLGGRIFWYADSIDEWEELGFPSCKTEYEKEFKNV